MSYNEWALCDYTPGHVGWNLPEGCFWLDVYIDSLHASDFGRVYQSPEPNCPANSIWNYYAVGTAVRLTAQPRCGYRFDSWGGDIGGSTNPVTVIMDANMSVFAHFAELPPCWDPNEPNNSLASATPLAWGQSPSAVEICPADDVDYFVFAADSAETMLVPPSGSTRLTLLDSNGVTLVSVDVSGFWHPLGFRLPEPGSYYLRVEAGSGYDPADCHSRFYSLKLERIASPAISSWSTSRAPTIDGVLSPGEWTDAATYDMSFRQDLTYPVTLYLMNDADHLYIAVDNPNDTTAEEDDATRVWFDDDPSPPDGQWANVVCGNGDGEGVFMVRRSTVSFGEFVNVTSSCPPVEPAPGVSGALGLLSGHSQTEVAIDLLSSALRMRPGERFGFYIETWNPMSGKEGIWPGYIEPELPVYYGWLGLPVAYLSPGWNLVSIPHTLHEGAVADVLEPISGHFERVFAYDATNGANPWKRYSVGAPSWANDLKGISERMGLWVKVTEATTLTIFGSVPVSTTIPLTTGWNLIGYPSLETRRITEALSSIDGLYTQVYAYDAAHPENPWQVFDAASPPPTWSLTVMEPGRGYWIKATEPCSLTINNQ